jgi:predicted permease
METLAADLRYALRTFRKAPGFTAAAVLLLALGIGANTAIFSVTSALLLKPLPYKDAERLVILWNRSPGLGITQDWFSTAAYFDIKGANAGFEELAIAIGGNENLGGEGAGAPERVGAVHMSSSLLPMLGASVERGRLFTPAEDAAGSAPVALLSYGLWMRKYAGDPGVLGRALLLNGKPCEVVGILPRRFSLPREVMPTLNGAERADVILPLPMAPDAANARGHEDYNIVGKLKPGVTVREAQTRLDALTARLRHDFPEVYPPNGGLTFGIVPLKEQVVGDVQRPLLLLQGAVGLVLAIACVNVANLLLSRAVARQKEIAVRTAIGASAGRIVRQLLTESALLGVLGGALGIGFAFLGVQGVRVLGTRSVPRLQEVGVDAAALAFTLAVSVVSSALFGLAPALRAVHLDLVGSLKDADRGASGGSALWGRGNNLRRLLVVAELALSLVLLVGAGLLLKSFARVENVSPGFDAKGVLTMELTATGPKYKDAEAVRTGYKRLYERFEAIPGVTAAGGVTSLPLSEMFAWGPVVVEGRVPPPGEKFLNADQRLVGGRYFEAMKIPLLSGRLFDEHDTPEKPRVVLVDQHMAKVVWPGQDPLGKRIALGDLAAERSWATVVGVVGNVKQDALDADSRIALYLSQTQGAGRSMNVVVRAKGDPAALVAAVRRELDAVDRDLPLYRVMTMDARVAESLARRRFTTLLLGLFAGVALVLAAVGIYGVMSYLVRQGTREIGIRMAIGATPRGVLALVIKQGMALALAGVLLGLVASLALTRLLSRLLFGVAPHDLATLSSISLLLGAVALLATLLPARRAARVDPMKALRSE